MTPSVVRLRRLCAPLIRRAFYGFAAVPGVRRAAACFAGRLVILTYHRVRPAEVSGGFTPIRSLEVSPELFREQLQFLKQQNWRLLSLDTALAELASGNHRERICVITFDDGYRDNLEFALPILEEYGVPALLYATAGFIEGSVVPWWHELEHLLRETSTLSVPDESRPRDIKATPAKEEAFRELQARFYHAGPEENDRLLKALLAQCPRSSPPKGLFLNWQELKEMADSELISIGAHGLNHYPLARLSESELDRDLRESRALLEKHVHRELRHFAYPFGSAGEACDRVQAAVARAGFKTAVTTVRGFADRQASVLALPRLCGSDLETVGEFATRLVGLDRWMP